MNNVPHDFVTVDMRGLKAALVARSHERRVSVSVLVRDAVGRTLSSDAKPAQPEFPNGDADTSERSETVKVSIRLTRDEVRRIDAGAQSAGLSRAAFLAGILDGVRALSSGGRREHLAALISSNAELSTLSRNLRHLALLLARSEMRAAQEYRSMLDALAGDVGRHLNLTGDVLVHLQPHGLRQNEQLSGRHESRGGPMSDPNTIDGVLVKWGERLFYPGNRIVKVKQQPKLAAHLLRQRANEIRARIEVMVVRRAPQVMVKVTGGGPGMKAIAAHFKYISKNGRLDIEDDRGEVLRGTDDLRGLADDWRLGGTPIDYIGFRREAFNIMLSMPRGVDPLYVLKAAREFAETELADHKYVMVLHDHQANPHVHLSVRAESRHGRRLNPRKHDLSRWRQTFAERLRGWGVEAEASSRMVRGQDRNGEALWRIKAHEDGRLLRARKAQLLPVRNGVAVEGWMEIASALAKSRTRPDRDLSEAIVKFARSTAPNFDRGGTPPTRADSLGDKGGPPRTER